MQPGELDRATVTAYRGSVPIARGRLRDSRRRTYIEFAMPGGETGRKPSHIEGSVEIWFDEVHESPLAAELRAHVERRRVSQPIVFAIEVDGARSVIQDCQLAGYFGGGLGPAGGWFGLSGPGL